MKSKEIKIKEKEIKIEITQEQINDLKNHFIIDCEKEIEKLLLLYDKKKKREERFKKLNEINKK